MDDQGAGGEPAHVLQAGVGCSPRGRRPCRSPGTASRSPPPGRWPSTSSGTPLPRPSGSCGCAPETIPLSLLLQSRPELAESFGPEVAALLVPLLEDPLAADDAVAALRRYSLISPSG